jgi:hypothetical protein
MDPYKLIKEMGGEITCNRAVARVGGERVVIAKVTGDGLELTAEGEELAATFKPVKPNAAKPKTEPTPSGSE